MLKKIPRNIQERWECSRRFQGMFKKILGNCQEDSGECSMRFWWVFMKVPRNVQQDSGEYSTRVRGIFMNLLCMSLPTINKDYYYYWNVQQCSRDCSTKFRERFKKIPGKFSKKFRGMLAKISVNTQKDWTLYNTKEV